MIDIHSHILPSIDDGAQNEEEALALARAAEAEGIHTVAATPHHQNGSFVNEAADIRAKTRHLNDAVQAAGINVTIIPGQETRIHGEYLEEWEKGTILPVGGNTDYVLIEFPLDHVPRYASQLLYDIQLKGLIPVIVHPERNEEIKDRPNLLYSLVKNGSLTQLTAASLTGRFGSKAKQLSLDLLEANLAHLIASDAHDTEKRGFHLQEGYAAVETKFNARFVKQLQANAQRLIQNERLLIDPPEHVKKKKFLGLF
ncbi:tyrosine-protein phosphatase [Alkalicoccus chagannorensis]|uniref:tyrosine-protein phosphatase n=1 Tax=Alkalicoccus chagannorensis TaxID=427072 RepID=UPI0003FDCAB1|nr:CpsB/CapC family capsule biosynthesis tyrosine phosphatase [Alkalicoccus chagannorensis]